MHTRTSKNCGRIHVESGGNVRPGDAFRGYNQTICAPTRRLDAPMRGSGRQDRCVAPRKVSCAQGLTRAFVKLL